MHHHHHGHDCHHHHAPPDFGRLFLISIILNSGFIVVEVIWGLKVGSLALLADAGHNASDVLALVMAWVGSTLARRKPSDRFTYGMRSSSIMASLLNAMTLMLVVGGIGWESLNRLITPEATESASHTIMIIAACGLVVNGGTALLFVRARKHDINVRAVFQHMAADALISLGVVIAGGVMLLTGWQWVDPAMGLMISAMIVLTTWGLLKESFGMAMQAVPKEIDPAVVKAYLQTLPGVREVHDLHIWHMSTTEIATTAHLVVNGAHPGDAFIRDVAQQLQERFKIGHTTVQIELGDTGSECPLAPEHVV